MLNRAQLVKLTSKAKLSGPIDSLIRYNPVSHNAARRMMAAFERAAFEERQRLSAELLTRSLRHASATRYGRDQGPTFQDWPILTKKMVRDEPDRFVRRSVFRIPAATSGTTGTPLKLWRSFSSVGAERAFIDWLLDDPALSFGRSRTAVLRGDDVKPLSDQSPPYGIYTHGGRNLILSGGHLSAETLDWFVEALEQHRPAILEAYYPSRLTDFVAMLQTSAKALRIPVVLCTSEILPAAARRLIGETLSARVIDSYGQAERVCQAVSHRPGEYWFNPAYGLVELMMDPTEDAGSADKSARIIATGFWNSIMPLIRYDTGDRTIIPAGTTESDLAKIAAGMMPFTGIAGRSGEFLLAPDGRRILALNHIPREVDNLLQVQLVQRNFDEVVIRVRCKPGFGANDRERLIQNARNKIPDSMAVRVEVVDRLTVLPSGKTPLVIREVPCGQPGFRGPEFRA